jgi:hypothetical protein
MYPILFWQMKMLDGDSDLMRLRRFLGETNQQAAAYYKASKKDQSYPFLVHDTQSKLLV